MYFILFSLINVYGLKNDLTKNHINLGGCFVLFCRCLKRFSGAFALETSDNLSQEIAKNEGRNIISMTARNITYIQRTV